jgi:hypothetical protein
MRVLTVWRKARVRFNLGQEHRQYLSRDALHIAQVLDLRQYFLHELLLTFTPS